MQGFHAICGLPRSGSTLLANILNQNPAFHASSTSALSSTVGGVVGYWGQAPEIKSDMAHDKAGTEARMLRVLRGLVASWYQIDKTVFDKGRGWVTIADVVAQAFPDARLFCTVRDPRDVFASVQKQHLAFPALNDAPGETVMDKANRMFSPGGMIGGPMRQIEDHLRRRSQSVVPILYEDLSKDPERELRKVYAELKMNYWDGHDFNDVQDTSTDLDALYLNKFPHDGSGKVEKRASEWSEFVPGDVANAIQGGFPGFNKAFGYA